MSFDGTRNDIFNEIPYISLSYSNADSQTSALRLILTLFPDWEHSDGKIEFIRFKEGITNTVCLCLLWIHILVGSRGACLLIKVI